MQDSKCYIRSGNALTYISTHFTICLVLFTVLDLYFTSLWHLWAQWTTDAYDLCVVVSHFLFAVIIPVVCRLVGLFYLGTVGNKKRMEKAGTIGGGGFEFLPSSEKKLVSAFFFLV